jgi:RNA polymerase primary sigma factor
MADTAQAQVMRDPRLGRRLSARRTDATSRFESERPAQPRGAALRKLRPTAKLPTPSLLRRLAADDLALLTRLLSEPMECVYHDSFPRPSSERTLTEVLDRIGTAETPTLSGDPDVPAASSTKTLTAAEEQELFLCLNYCRYRVMRLSRKYAGQRLTLAAARAMLKWARAALRTRTHIIEANLSLVPAMAKRSKTSGVDIGDLICEGNLALLRSVDKFDCARGFKFSTYACRAILSSFSSSSAKASRYRSCFPTEFDPALEKSDYLERRRELVEHDCISGLKNVLSKNLAGLSSVEQEVLRARFDLDRPADDAGPTRAKTLKQVAQLIGVTKERVRQIQNKALDKLRSVIEEDILAA